MKDGVLIINKEKGYTSHDVVARLRGILHMRRIGHTGTLDPSAEGVLPVLLGKATRLSEFLTDKEKTYEALLRLGVETDTQDMTGSVLKERPVRVTEEEVRAAAASFLGEQQQIPPMYSALKVSGKKLYELAREGKTVEREPRTVYFHKILVQEIKLPLVRLTVTCGRGTYIRTLCHDLGKKLGCGGAMEELVRTASGLFTLSESLTLDEVREKAEEGTLEKHITGIEEILREYPRILVCTEGDRLLLNGNTIPAELIKDSRRTESAGADADILAAAIPAVSEKVRMCTSKGAFIGLYRHTEDGYKPVRMFL